MSTVTRIKKEVYDKAIDAMPVDKAEYMDKSSWISYLVLKGLEKISEQK